MWLAHIARLGLFLFALTVTGLPTVERLSQHNDSLAISTFSKRAENFELRILSLGASIVWGVGSSDQNGFRKPLRDQLRWDGWSVNMVGSRRNGNMADDDVQANPGDTIDVVKAASKNSLIYRPNVVLINAGTNDARLNIDVNNAGQRMRVLIEEMLAAPGMDKTTIVLSTLIPLNAPEDVNRLNINNQYRNLVNAMQGEGKSVVLADMDPPAPHAGNGFIRIPDDMADPIHPNDSGFRKMAYVWWIAINDARTRGYLKPPNESGVPAGSSGTTCDKEFGNGVYAGKTQKGSGEDDGIYRHKSESKGVVLTVHSDYDRNQWFFARLWSRDRDDLLGWFKLEDGSVIYGCWRNTGNEANRFVKVEDLSVKDNCGISGVHFIDINADGLDDFVCIGPQGTAYASINLGDGTDSRPPTFRYIGQIKTPIAGYDQSRVLLGDIDGDGRADYCVSEGNGDIRCWRNGGWLDAPMYWQAMGTRFKGKGMGNIAGTRFEDVNGDGRDDWTWVGDKGEVHTWTNARSCQKGREGDGLNVAWRQGFNQDATSGPTHLGMGKEGVRNRIHFARIYGEPQDFGLLGRQDYVFMDHSKDGNRHKFEMKVWKNVGYGGTKLKADGSRYCNMMGHDDGREDLVWIHSKGRLTIYPNRGITKPSESESYWGGSFVAWDPSKLIGRNLDRRDIHLMDWDGDGVCDIVWVDPNNQNRMSLWRNRYKELGRWDWEYQANPAPQVTCNQQKGIGIWDLAVRFGDISGNGRDDYICMEKDGRSFGWVHNDAGGWDYIDQYKFSIEKDRANIRFADVNGDGRDDMIWIDKWNGDSSVWYNMGRRDISGSRYEWRPVGKVYQGNNAGTCAYFPDLDGNGRADIHFITGTFYNTAETWYNVCGAGDGMGDDSDGIHDPKLPSMPGTTPGSGGGGGGGDGAQVCISGSGLGLYFELCRFTCKYGFCPKPCYCEKVGPRIPTPNRLSSTDKWYGTIDDSYRPLCDFSCRYGNCPDDTCVGVPAEAFPIYFGHGGNLPWECDGAGTTWKCSTGNCKALTDLRKSNADRWNEVQVDTAIGAMFDTWRHASNNNLFKTSALGQWFVNDICHMYGGWTDAGDNAVPRAPSEFKCGILGDGTCTKWDIKCGTTALPSLDFALIAFQNLHNYLNRMYTTVASVKADAPGIARDMESDFGADKDSGLELFRAVLSGFNTLVPMAAMGPVGTFLGGATSAVETIFAFSDLMENVAGSIQHNALEDGFHGEGKIASAVETFVDMTLKSIDKLSKWMFGGETAGNYDLRAMLKDGAFLQSVNEGQKSTYDMGSELKRMLKKQMIPHAWKASKTVFPAVLFVEGHTEQNPGDIISDAILAGIMDGRLSRSARIHHTTSGGEKFTFWLVNVPSSNNDWKFAKLRNFDQLTPDGDLKDYGVTWQQIVLSSVNGWLANKKQNGYQISKDKHKKLPFDMQHETPGFYNLPVCHIFVADSNVFGRRQCAHYPCCEK